MRGIALQYRADGVDGPQLRKWKESKQQPSMLPGPAVPGCCLSFYFLWAIHPIDPVDPTCKVNFSRYKMDILLVSFRI